MTTEEELDMFRSKNLIGLFSLLVTHSSKPLVDLIINELNHCKHIYTIHPNVFALILPHVMKSGVSTTNLVRLYETATRNMLRHHSGHHQRREPNQPIWLDRLCEFVETCDIGDSEPPRADFDDWMMRLLDLAETMIQPKSPESAKASEAPEAPGGPEYPTGATAIGPTGAAGPTEPRRRIKPAWVNQVATKFD